MNVVSNEQRKAFALPPIRDDRTVIEVPPCPTDMFYMVAFLENRQVKKVIQYYDEQPGQHMYSEYCVYAELSEDLKFLLPRTVKGKPQKRNTANLIRRTRIGMSLNYGNSCVSLTNETACVDYYTSLYDDVRLDSLWDFSQWIGRWCEETTERDLQEIQAFSHRGRVHQGVREGDFFRFRISRRLYAYGRILLNLDQMRKQGAPFWDVFLGKPLCVAVYHALSETPSLTSEDLLGRKMLTSQMIMDNIFFYGECERIGNVPLTPREAEFPIHYGNTIAMGERGVRYQCGTTFIAREDQQALYGGFRNNGIGWALDVKLPILRKCIE